MYLKIQTFKNDDVIERVIECEDVIIKRQSDRPSVALFWIVRDNDGPHQSPIEHHVLPDEVVQAYLMANDGRTIDRYRWQGEEVGAQLEHQHSETVPVPA